MERAHPPLEAPKFEIRVNGPDCEALGASDLRRLFPGGSLTQSRLDRLAEWPRIVVMCGTRVVAVSTCQKTDLELRVPDVGVDASCGCSEREIIDSLLDALELAALAGGCRRLVVMPPKGAPAYLQRRGYTTISERCAGGWLERALA